jgi:hypothetical protein
MRNRYGTNIAEAMLACCNTKLFLQTVDRETRAWASQTIGDCEVELRSSTDTLAFGADLPRTTLNTQRQFRPAVLESELRLEPHHGFLLLPDGVPVARIHLTADHITARAHPANGSSPRQRTQPCGAEQPDQPRRAQGGPNAGAGVMVATVSALSSASQAASYYEADDYYAEGGLPHRNGSARARSIWAFQARWIASSSAPCWRAHCGRAAWHHARRQGRASPRLGHYAVRAQIGLDHGRGGRGQAPDRGPCGGGQSGAGPCREAYGGHAHQNGAEVEREATGNLAIATFRHDTSRAQDPQLHTHAVVLNATRDQQGAWRSLEPRAIYQLQKDIGAIYRQELAHGVAQLGYTIERGKDPPSRLPVCPKPLPKRSASAPPPSRRGLPSGARPAPRPAPPSGRSPRSTRARPRPALTMVPCAKRGTPPPMLPDLAQRRG